MLFWHILCFCPIRQVSSKTIGSTRVANFASQAFDSELQRTLLGQLCFCFVFLLILHNDSANSFSTTLSGSSWVVVDSPPVKEGGTIHVAVGVSVVWAITKDYKVRQHPPLPELVS